MLNLLIFEQFSLLFQLHFEGMTGNVEFDEYGFRKNYDLDVYNVGLQYGPEKVCVCIYTLFVIFY